MVSGVKIGEKIWGKERVKEKGKRKRIIELELEKEPEGFRHLKG